MVENTVIITAENKEKTISRTIQSCINQTNKNFKIVIAYSRLKNEKSNITDLHQKYTTYKSSKNLVLFLDAASCH